MLIVYILFVSYYVVEKGIIISKDNNAWAQERIEDVNIAIHNLDNFFRDENSIIQIREELGDKFENFNANLGLLRMFWKDSVNDKPGIYKRLNILYEKIEKNNEIVKKTFPDIKFITQSFKQFFGDSCFIYQLKDFDDEKGWIETKSISPKKLGWDIESDEYPQPFVAIIIFTNLFEKLLHKTFEEVNLSIDPQGYSFAQGKYRLNKNYFYQNEPKEITVHRVLGKLIPDSIKIMQINNGRKTPLLSQQFYKVGERISFPNLKPGNYDIVVSEKGFDEYKSNLNFVVFDDNVVIEKGAIFFNGLRRVIKAYSGPLSTTDTCTYFLNQDNSWQYIQFSPDESPKRYQIRVLPIPKGNSDLKIFFANKEVLLNSNSNVFEFEYSIRKTHEVLFTVRGSIDNEYFKYVMGEQKPITITKISTKDNEDIKVYRNEVKLRFDQLFDAVNEDFYSIKVYLSDNTNYLFKIENKK